MITEYRMRQLKKHLLLLEKLTGMPLRKEPRDLSCPIEMFAPDFDKDGDKFEGFGYTIVAYGRNLRKYIIKEAEKDARHFCHLSKRDKQEMRDKITKWVQSR